MTNSPLKNFRAFALAVRDQPDRVDQLVRYLDETNGVLEAGHELLGAWRAIEDFFVELRRGTEPRPPPAPVITDAALDSIHQRAAASVAPS